MTRYLPCTKKVSADSYWAECCPPKNFKHTGNAGHNTFGTELSPLSNPSKTDHYSNWDYADWFQKLCYPILAGSGIIMKKWILLKFRLVHAQCVKFLTVSWWGFQSFDNSLTRYLDNSRHLLIHQDHPDTSNVDSLLTPCVHQIHNMCWQYPLRYVYPLWQLHDICQLLLCLVRNIVSNRSRPSLRVRVQGQTEPLPNWQSGSSIYRNRQLG